MPAAWNGLPNTDTAGVVVRDNDFDNRLSTDSSYYGGFIRGSYDTTGAFVGAPLAGNRGTSTTSGSTAATTATNGTFYDTPLADGNVSFRQTLPSHNIDDYTLNWFQNPNGFKLSLPKSDGLNLMGNVRHKLDEDLELFGELMAYNAHSITGRGPNSFDATTDYCAYVSAANLCNPFCVRLFEANGLPDSEGTSRRAPEMFADFIAVNADRPSFSGAQHNVVAALVLCQADAVDHSFINGRRVVDLG